MLVLALVCRMPIWVMISTSFNNEITIFEGTQIRFFFVPTFDNYEYIDERKKFVLYLLNSVIAIVATVSTFLALFLGG